MGRLGEFIVNHWILSTAFVVIVFLIITTELKRKLLGFKDLPPNDVIQKMNRDDAIVIDVRDQGEFDRGHILNAINIPFGVLESRMNEIQEHKDKPVIIACRTGQNSAKACMQLKQQGFNDIHKLGGGMMAWTNASLPTAETDHDA